MEDGAGEWDGPKIICLQVETILLYRKHGVQSLNLPASRFLLPCMISHWKSQKSVISRSLLRSTEDRNQRKRAKIF